MRLDHIFVLVLTTPDGDDIVSAFTHEADAIASCRSYAAARIERVPLASYNGAGIAATAEEGRHEVDDALEDADRVMRRHNVTGCCVGVNAFHAAAKTHFPAWSTIQVDDAGNISVRFLDGPDSARTDASVDLLNRMTVALAQQTKGMARLAEDVRGRMGRDQRIVVVPGLPSARGGGR